MSQGKFATYKTVVSIFALSGGIWLVGVAAVIFATPAFSDSVPASKLVADGSIYMSVIALQIAMVAMIAPPILAIRPLRLWQVLRHQRDAATPRQMFRAIYPTAVTPSLVAAAAVLPVLFACVFSMISPIVPVAAALALLTTSIGTCGNTRYQQVS